MKGCEEEPQVGEGDGAEEVDEGEEKGRGVEGWRGGRCRKGGVDQLPRESTSVL
jgi:hypothetical protein